KQRNRSAASLGLSRAIPQSRGVRTTLTLHQGIRRMDAMSDALLISLAIWGMIGCAALRVLALLG
ncbi:hypothetical protein, partial [Bradyrhizobium sp. 23]|uniref:hypothetical protein n=1 Tax=Bradyrhizobium sp. 23 TaxID=2782667 RepID=UPI001FF9719B